MSNLNPVGIVCDMENPLKAQLGLEKFRHAVAYVEQEACGIKKLDSGELLHINQILTGNEGGWREETAKITIPTGETHHFNLISNPQSKARELIGAALEMLGNGDTLGSCHYLYSHLVREHLFRDANRRTAILAIHWLLVREGHSIDIHDLLNISLGNLRDNQELEVLKSKMSEYIKL